MHLDKNGNWQTDVDNQVPQSTAKRSILTKYLQIAGMLVLVLLGIFGISRIIPSSNSSIPKAELCQPGGASSPAIEATDSIYTFLKGKPSDYIDCYVPSYRPKAKLGELLVSGFNETASGNMVVVGAKPITFQNNKNTYEEVTTSGTVTVCLTVQGKKKCGATASLNNGPTNRSLFQKVGNTWYIVETWPTGASSNSASSSPPPSTPSPKTTQKSTPVSSAKSTPSGQTTVTPQVSATPDGNAETQLTTWLDSNMDDLTNVVPDDQNVQSDASSNDTSVASLDCSDLSTDLTSLNNDKPAPIASINTDYQAALTDWNNASSVCETNLTQASTDITNGNNEIVQINTEIQKLVPDGSISITLSSPEGISIETSDDSALAF